MSAELIDLAQVRELRALQRQVLRLQAEAADLRLRAQPEVAARVLYAQAVQLRNAHAHTLAQARGPLLQLLAVLIAAQVARHEEVDPLRALAVALAEPRVRLDMDGLVGERLAGLPAALASLSRVYGSKLFEAPPPEPGAA